MKPSIELINSCIKGKEKAQYELFKLCFPYLMSISMRYHKNEEDALHVLNIAFYKILSNIGSHKQESSFKAWARTIMVNTIITEHRKNVKYKTTMAPVDFAMENGSLEDWEFDEINEKINSDFLLDKMNELEEPERTVLNLYVIEGYNHKEIAEMLDFPEGTSKWHLSKARKNLKRILTKVIELNKALLL